MGLIERLLWEISAILNLGRGMSSRDRSAQVIPEGQAWEANGLD